MVSEKNLDEYFSQVNDKSKEKNRNKSFDVGQYFYKNRTYLLIALIGFALFGLGLFFLKSNIDLGSNKIEVLEDATQSQEQTLDVVVEIAGAVQKPGVYKLNSDARIEDLLISAGGLSQDADRVWVERYINKAAKIVDGQKIFIQREGDLLTGDSQQSSASSDKNSDDNKPYQDVLSGNYEGLININTATLKELDVLPGIGPVYGQNIIEGRPYSSCEELLSRGVLKQSTYEKIKEKITVY